METTKLCPKCGALSYWDSYFQAYCCTSNKCGYMEYVKQESQLDRIERKLDLIYKRLQQEKEEEEGRNLRP